MKNKEKTLEDQKKTDFPDLKRLPDHDSFKHLLSVLSNMPKSFFENLYEACFLKDKIELEKLKIQLIQKEMELEIYKFKSKLKEMEKFNFNYLVKR